MAKVVQEKPHPLQPRRSTQRPSVWELGGLTWRQLGTRLWTAMDSNHDDIFDRAAVLAFYYFLSLFPALLLVMVLLGAVAASHPAVRDTLFQYAAQALPPDAWQLVQKTLAETVQSATGWKAVVGIVGALWSASSGTSSTMTVLNFAYHTEERRSWVKSRLGVAVWLTVVLVALMFAAVGIVLGGGWVAHWLYREGVSDDAVRVWRVFQYMIAVVFVILSFAVLYRYGPDVKEQKWYWITPGSLLGVLLWMGISAGFRVYLHYFDNYSATYGSLGAVAILMMYFYITSLAFLVGAEINAIIEHAAAEHGRADAKLRGEKEAPAA